MNKTEIEQITLTGISLKRKTWNANGQSAIDCGSLWQQFAEGNYAAKIPGKINDDICAVYHNYDGDHTMPYSFFIGCKVKSDTPAPEGFESLIIPTGLYQQIIATGKMPDCLANAWREIWASDIDRAYQPDFEVYGEKSKDWNNSEVEIFLSVKS